MTLEKTEKETLSVESWGERFMANITVLSLVRLIGAVLLIVSASTFMVQQVAEQNDLVRYGALLGHTLVLGTAGFFCALKLSESRSARTFFAIVLASVPVHFSVLSGLLYSQFQWDNAIQTWQPDIWTAPSALAAVTALGVGWAVLLPLTLFSMMSLARKHALSLTGAFLLMNGLLLIPVRFPNVAVWVVLVGWALYYLMEQRYFSKQSTLKTTEGRILRAILLVPVVLILGRTVYFYSGTVWFHSLAFTGTVFFLYLFARRLPVGPKWVQIALTPLVVIGAMVCLDSGLNVLNGIVGYGTGNSEYRVVIYWLLVCATIFALGAVYVGDSQNYYRISLLSAMATSMIHMFTSPTLLTTAVAVVTPTAGIGLAIHYQQKITFAASILVLLLCAVFHLHDVVRLSSVSHWSVLLGAGVLLIVGASIIERKRDAMLLRVQHLRTAFQMWGY